MMNAATFQRAKNDAARRVVQPRRRERQGFAEAAAGVGEDGAEGGRRGVPTRRLREEAATFRTADVFALTAIIEKRCGVGGPHDAPATECGIELQSPISVNACVAASLKPIRVPVPAHVCSRVP